MRIMFHRDFADDNYYMKLITENPLDCGITMRLEVDNYCTHSGGYILSSAQVKEVVDYLNEEIINEKKTHV
jgi:hypothetical protein